MTASDTTIVEIPLGDRRLKEFVDFPWKLYKGDPCWTPPLNGDLLGNRLLGLKGILTDNHPYHKHSKVTHFMAYRSGKPVGRVSAAVNEEFNQHYNSSIGFFGFFEVIDDYDVASMLLDQARKWLTGCGVAVMRGPGEYSNATHERQGILIDGFQYPPTVELTHNPPYYAGFLDRYGFNKAKDYVAYILNRDIVNVNLVRKMANVVRRQHPEIEMRPLVFKKLREEVRLIVEIYNEAWAKNWGFMPLSSTEADSIADTLQLIVDPKLIFFAYVNGQAAAVMGLIPDPNYALRPRWKWYGDSDLVRVARLLSVRRTIPHIRAMFGGIKPQFRMTGLPALLAGELLEHYLGHYFDIDISMMLEDNTAILRLVETFGGKYYKKWRIYELPLK
jgi:hypothetical protein